MKDVLMLLVLLASTIGAGCKSLTRASLQATQSSFLSHFSLQKTAGAVSATGLNCSRPASSGGIGSSAGGIGSEGITHNRTDMISCEVDGSIGFDEAQVLRALRSDVEKEIQNSGAQIQGGGYSGGNRFYVQYAEGNIRGRIEISGERQQRYYTLTAMVDEASK